MKRLLLASVGLIVLVAAPALAADLVKEEPGDAIDYSVIVRLRNSPKSVQDERDEPPLGNGRANELVGTRHPRFLGHGSLYESGGAAHAAP